MKKILFNNLLSVCLITFFLLSHNFISQTVQTFSFTGSAQTFTVPTCVSIITVNVKGAQGAYNTNNSIAPSNTSALGGLGGMVTGVLTVTPGTVLNILVGGMNGFNGGGAAGTCTNCASAGGGNGGGASDIRIGGTALANRVLVAGGGGGAGGDRIPTCGRGAGGGGGGGYYGGGGGAGWWSSSGSQATGGTQTVGGLGGTSSYSASNNGFAGTLGVGGMGGGELGSGQGTPIMQGYNGGPGGGLLGANSTGTNFVSWWVGDGGGGGSSYTGILTNATTSTGVQQGNGVITFSYYLGMVVNLTANTLVCQGNTVNISYPGALTYTWSNSATGSLITVTPTNGATYSVTGTTSGCTYTGITTISVSPGIPTLSINSSTNSICLGKSVTLTASGAINYTWTNPLVQNGVGFTPTVTTNYVVSGQNGCGTSTTAVTVSVGPLPVTLAASPTLICAGSPATLTAVSAATAYAWSPGNLTASMAVVGPTTATIYTIAVTDGTCYGGGIVALAVNPIPTIGITTTTNNNICSGSSAMITATGGISYTWMPGGSTGSLVTVTPTAATLYSVTGSNSFGCTNVANQVIIPQPAPNIVLNPSSSYICPGDQVTLTASGANTYTWVNPTSNNAVVNVNPTTPTIYTVSGSNTVPCVSSQTVLVDVFIQTVTITGNTVICNGKNTNLTGNGADNYTWNGANFSNGNSATYSPTTTTTYTLSTSTFTNGITCPYTKTFQIVVNPKPNITAALTRTTFCKGETNTLTANGAQTYTWNNGGGNAATVVINGSFVTVFNYSVSGTDANGCVNSATILVTISACTGIENLEKESQIKIYPNPSNGEFVIQSNQTVELRITNELGQTVRTISLSETNNYKTEISGIGSGIYFVKDESNFVRVKVMITQ